MGGTKSESKLFIQHSLCHLNPIKVDFRSAALQFSILHELSSGKLAMHKQAFFLSSSQGHEGNRCGQINFLPPACAAATGGIIEADKRAKDRRRSAGGEKERGVEE